MNLQTETPTESSVKPALRVKYVVISPVRDEAAYLRFTIRSMISQTIRPTQWILVNDGSTDKTAAIIDEAATQHSWITPVHRINRGFRQAGGGVVQAFNEGYSRIAISDWQFVVKLDGDLSFDADYFERCFTCFRNEPRLGVGGGAMYHMVNGHEHLEKGPVFHVRGATKIYSRECWDAIGGFVPAAGWDTLDEVKAQMLGWNTRCFFDIRLIHHRTTGAADGSWKSSVKYGKANYVSGYHPLFVLAKSVRRLLKKPYIIDSAGILYGYISSYFNGTSRVDDPRLIAFVRRQQLRRLIGAESIWK